MCLIGVHSNIWSQEMANPRVRPHLHFLPEDAGLRLAEAWQGHRWLHELDSELTTPMVRSEGQDYYIFEPALLRDGRACVPHRWFIREDHIWARAWTMTTTGTGSGHRQWVILEHSEVEIPIASFSMAFPRFQRSFSRLKVPSPQSILGTVMFSSAGVNALIRCSSHAGCQKVASGEIAPWTYTDSQRGNRWRSASQGHRVVAFPVWLYCDDTSGNVSKKWNKHNSFLFTAAGLPRRFVHQESSIHFLSTSNVAPPLEMLDGIVRQLRCAYH